MSTEGQKMVDPEVLRRAVEVAEQCLPLQGSQALYQAMTVGEIEDERRLAGWERSIRRRDRRRRVRAEIAADARLVRSTLRLERQEARQQRWLATARADRARATNADALVGGLHRQAKRSSLLLRCVIGVGLLWSAVNVGRNLTPETTQPDLTWWLLWALSFGIEAMISVPILTIMAQGAAAARLGKHIDRTKIILFETGLLCGTVGLNCGPHVAAWNLGRAAEYAVAPVMVVVLMWLHAWLASRYADLIESISGTEFFPVDQATPEHPPLLREELVSLSAFDEWSSRSDDAWPSTGERLDEDEAIGASGPPVQEDIEAELEPTQVLMLVRSSTEVARELVATRRSEKTEAEIAAILDLAAQGQNAHAIAGVMTGRSEVSWSRSTVDRIITRARECGWKPIKRPRLEVVAESTTA